MRPCGECEQCCITPDIPELGKPAGERCKHLALTGGCSIYESRPTVCRGFSCLWAEGQGKESERPDHSGILVYRQPKLAQALELPEVFVAHEHQVGAWERESRDSDPEYFPLGIDKRTGIIYVVEPGRREYLIGGRAVQRLAKDGARRAIKRMKRVK